MCLIVLARHVHPGFPLVVAANRDEFFAREAAPLAQWTPEQLRAGLSATAPLPVVDSTLSAPQYRAPGSSAPAAPGAVAADPGVMTSDTVIAGRDLVGGGTWMAVSGSGRFAAVTNVREPVPPTAPLSRGQLPLWALAGTLPSGLEEFGPVNLLSGDAEELLYCTNRGHFGTTPLPVDEGVHSLSNATLDAPWPKARAAAAGLAEALRDWSGPAGGGEGRSAAGAAAEAAPEEAGAGAGAGAMVRRLDRTPEWAVPLLAPLLSRRRAPLQRLPQTGVGVVHEWFLSAPFVRMPGYGTRAQTAIAIDVHGTTHVVERRFDADGAPCEITEARL